MNFDYIIQSTSLNNENSSIKIKPATSSTHYHSNRFIDSILRLFLSPSSSSSSSSSSSVLNHNCKNNSKKCNLKNGNNRLMSINKIFSRSYVKTSPKSCSNNRKSIGSNYKFGVYNNGNSCCNNETDIYVSSNSTKSIYSSISSKELSWYKMEELDPYYQVLGNNY